MSRTDFLFVFVLICALTACSPVSASEAPNASPYQLPWPADLGKDIFVTQGQNQGNHIGSSAYALDFDFDGGEDVLAARAGTVSDVHEGESICGGKDKSEYSNYVVIDHGDGQYSYYGHLMPDVVVSVGQTVQQGQLLGHVGNSGWTYCQTSRGGGTHLHFHVQSSDHGFGRSIPFSFADVSGNGIPQPGKPLTSKNGSVFANSPFQNTGNEGVSVSSGNPEGQISFMTVGEDFAVSLTVMDLESGSEETFWPNGFGFSSGYWGSPSVGYDWSLNGERISYASTTYIDFATMELAYAETKFSWMPTDGSATWPGSHTGSWIYFSCLVPNPHETPFVPYVPAICGSSIEDGGNSLAKIMDPADLDATAEDVLEHGGRQLIYSSPSFSEVDKVMAFLKIYPGGDEPYQLFVRIGSTFTHLETGFEVMFFPKVSPDGSTVAFVGMDQVNSTSEIWLIDADGTDLRQLTKGEGFGDYAGVLDWSPDGSWIVFEKGSCPGFCPPTTEDAWGGIWVVNVQTGEQTQIVDTPNIIEGNPAWIPFN